MSNDVASHAVFLKETPSRIFVRPSLHVFVRPSLHINGLSFMFYGSVTYICRAYMPNIQVPILLHVLQPPTQFTRVSKPLYIVFMSDGHINALNSGVLLLEDTDGVSR